MGYAKLYEHCQALNPHVKRNAVRDKVLALTGANQVRVIQSGMDESVCRGFYISARNTEHRFVQQCGSHVIVLARGLNRCWSRFVFVKELMHLFDGADMAADSGDKLETLLSEFGSATPENHSKMMNSEVVCFWRAMGVLCPEDKRLEFETARNQNRIDDYSIALQLRIPEQHVPRLFLPHYTDLMKYVIQV